MNDELTHERVGEKQLMNNGQYAQIIAYRNHRDIDIMFDDGRIVTNKTYFRFKNGSAGVPHAATMYNKQKEKYIGQKKMMKCGMYCTIIDYHNSGNIDVIFDDGTIRTGLQYSHFNAGKIGINDYKAIKQERINERRLMKNGEYCTIIAYRNNKDMDVQFEDGSVVTSVTYNHFVNGTIKNKNKYLNEEIISNCGLSCRIIKYKNSKNIDVEFEDGAIVLGRRYDDFKNMKIGHPSLPSQIGLTGMYHGCDVKLISKEQNYLFYRAKCKCCDFDDIVTWGQIIEHEKIHTK